MEDRQWALHLFWRRGDHLTARESAADRKRPILTNASGYVDPTFYDLSAFTGSAKFTDNVFTLADNSDPTKLAQFQLSSITAGQTRTLTVPDASGTLALLGLAQTWSALQTFTSGGITVNDNIFTLQDNSDTTKKAQFQLSGITASNTRTYTAPNADGTLALLGLAQEWSALQTFSSGVSFGNETLSAYDEGTWAVEITSSGGGESVTYTLQAGVFTRIGRQYSFTFDVRIDTISGGSGDIRISLPATVIAGTGYNFHCSCSLENVDLTATPATVTFQCVQAVAYGIIRTTRDNTTRVTEQFSALAAGDIITATGHFFV